MLTLPSENGGSQRQGTAGIGTIKGENSNRTLKAAKIAHGLQVLAAGLGCHQATHETKADGVVHCHGKAGLIRQLLLMISCTSIAYGM